MAADHDRRKRRRKALAVSVKRPTAGIRGFSGVAVVMDDHIFLASEEGEVIRQLTIRASGYKDLAFSPSGLRLAATKVEGDAMPQLLIIDVEDGGEEEVSWTNPDYSDAWTEADVQPWFGTMSWASEEVLYCNAVRSVGGKFRNYVVKYDLSVPEVEVIEVDAANPALSPDGKRLAYVRKPAEWEEVGVGSWGNLSPGDLMVRRLADGTTTKVDIAAGYVFDAAFSPDGEHMAVDCFSEPDTDLYYTDLEGNIIYALDMVGPSGTISTRASRLTGNTSSPAFSSETSPRAVGIHGGHKAGHGRHAGGHRHRWGYEPRLEPGRVGAGDLNAGQGIGRVSGAPAGGAESLCRQGAEAEVRP